MLSLRQQQQQRQQALGHDGPSQPLRGSDEGSPSSPQQTQQQLQQQLQPSHPHLQLFAQLSDGLLQPAAASAAIEPLSLYHVHPPHTQTGSVDFGLLPLLSCCSSRVPSPASTSSASGALFLEPLRSAAASPELLLQHLSDGNGGGGDGNSGGTGGHGTLSSSSSTAFMQNLLQSMQLQRQLSTQASSRSGSASGGNGGYAAAQQWPSRQQQQSSRSRQATDVAMSFLALSPTPPPPLSSAATAVDATCTSVAGAAAIITTMQTHFDTMQQQPQQQAQSANVRSPPSSEQLSGPLTLVSPPPPPSHPPLPPLTTTTVAPPPALLSPPAAVTPTASWVPPAGAVSSRPHSHRSHFTLAMPTPKPASASAALRRLHLSQQQLPCATSLLSPPSQPPQQHQLQHQRQHQRQAMEIDPIGASAQLQQHPLERTGGFAASTTATSQPWARPLEAQQQYQQHSQRRQQAQSSRQLSSAPAHSMTHAQQAQPTLGHSPGSSFHCVPVVVASVVPRLRGREPSSSAAASSATTSSFPPPQIAHANAPPAIMAPMNTMLQLPRHQQPQQQQPLQQQQPRRVPGQIVEKVPRAGAQTTMRSGAEAALSPPGLSSRHGPARTAVTAPPFAPLLASPPNRTVSASAVGFAHDSNDTAIMQDEASSTTLAQQQHSNNPTSVVSRHSPAAAAASPHRSTPPAAGGGGAVMSTASGRAYTRVVVGGDKKCSWPGCPASFRKLSTLLRHERVHTGDKPFRCEVEGCDAAFSEKGNLLRHENDTHAQVRRYACPFSNYCHLKFFRAAHAEQHVQSRHIALGEDPARAYLYTSAPDAPLPKGKRRSASLATTAPLPNSRSSSTTTTTPPLVTRAALLAAAAAAGASASVAQMHSSTETGAEANVADSLDDGHVRKRGRTSGNSVSSGGSSSNSSRRSSSASMALSEAPVEFPPPPPLQSLSSDVFASNSAAASSSTAAAAATASLSRVSSFAAPAPSVEQVARAASAASAFMQLQPD